MKYFYTIILILSTVLGYAQDNLHFSQFYNSPLTLNPAFAGRFQESIRFNAISRQQWTGIADKPGYFYQTIGASLDFHMFKRRMGGGIYLYSDKAGAGVFNTIKIMPTFSYNFEIGNNDLTFGLQPDIIMYQVDASKVTNGPQTKNSTVFDLNTGVNYRMDFYYVVVNAGLNASNLLRAPQNILNTGVPEKSPIYLKFYTNVEWGITPMLTLYPSLYASYQGKSTNMLLGTNFSTKLIQNKREGMKMYFGLWGRTNYLNLESLIPTFGFSFNDMLIMTSYDYNLDLSQGGASPYFQGLTNTFEISIIFALKTKPKIPMPEDKYLFNPRY